MAFNSLLSAVLVVNIEIRICIVVVVDVQGAEV